jgi:hypothetical protein
MRKIIFLSETYDTIRHNIMASSVYDTYSAVNKMYRRMIRKECAKYVLRDPGS